VLQWNPFFPTLEIEPHKKKIDLMREGRRDSTEAPGTKILVYFEF